MLILANKKLNAASNLLINKILENNIHLYFLQINIKYFSKIK